MKKLFLLAAASFLMGAGPAKDRPVVSEFAVESTVRCTRLLYGPEPRKTGKPPVGNRLGNRCPRLTYGPKQGDGDMLPNTPPAVTLSTAASSRAGAIIVRAAAKDAEDRNLLYTYSVTTGAVKGDGAQVLWIPGASARPGRYKLAAEVDDGCGCLGMAYADVTFEK